MMFSDTFSSLDRYDSMRFGSSSIFRCGVILFLLPVASTMASSTAHTKKLWYSSTCSNIMTEQNHKYLQKEIGKLLSEIWRVKGLAEQEYGQLHPITKKLVSMHADVQALLQEK
jgi:hypothetical protein